MDSSKMTTRSHSKREHSLSSSQDFSSTQKSFAELTSDGSSITGDTSSSFRQECSPPAHNRSLYYVCDISGKLTLNDSYEENMRPRNRQGCTPKRQQPPVVPVSSPPTNSKSSGKGSSFNWSMGAVVVLIYALITVYARYNRADPPNMENECRDSLERLTENHPEQDQHVINSIRSTTRGLLRNPNDVHSIVLLYSSASNSSQKFIDDILDTSVDCTATGKSHPIVLRRHDFTEAMERDPGHVLIEYGNKLKEERIMIVFELHKLPVGVVQAFHSLCDRYNPWTKPAAIFFTIDLDKVETEQQPEMDSNLDEIATRILKSNWATLPANVLDPLITRITDQVLFIH